MRVARRPGSPGDRLSPDDLPLAWANHCPTCLRKLPAERGALWAAFPTLIGQANILIAQ